MTDRPEPLPPSVRRAIDESRRLSPPADLLQAVVRQASRTPQRRRWRPFGSRAFSLAASAAVLLVAIIALPRLATILPPMGAAPTSIHLTPPVILSLPLGGTIAARIHVPDDAHPAGADSASVWLGVESSGLVIRLDATSGEELGRLQVNEPTDAAYDLWPVADGGSAWAAGRDDRSLVRIDVDSMQVSARWPIDTIPYRIQPAGGVVWVTSFEDGLVLKVDAADGSVLAKVSIPVATGVAVTPRAVYAVDYLGGLFEIDVITMTVTARYSVAGQATDMLAVGTDLWIWGLDGRLLERFDTAKGAIAASTERVTSVALLDGTAWAAVSDGALVSLDSSTLRWTAAVPLGGVRTDQLVASSDWLWAYAQSTEGTFLYAVEPRD